MGEEYKGGWKLNNQGPQIDQLLGMVSAANAAASGNGLQGNMGFVEDTTYSGCFYRNVTVNNQTVQEWLNPPLAIANGTSSSEEYRTTERFMGKPVYVKLINLGSIVTGNHRYTFSAIANFGNFCECNVLTTYDGRLYPLPASLGTNNELYITDVYYNYVEIFAGSNLPRASHDGDLHAILKYTKNS